MALASTILGVLALFSCWIPVFGWFGVAAGFIGLCMGISSIMDPWHRQMALFGLVSCLIAIITGLVLQIPLLLAMLE
ncbi:MAG: hypothetical protein GXP49_10390 [Deltaproteobacteria bacterium]|nr:hypothetical protein [Deltaproteobacteria bacterium]